MSSNSTSILPLGDGPSFGFGDRIGTATPGHVEAMRQAGDGVLPVFAQQSIREMQRTARTPEGVMRDALDGMASAGWSAGTGADADHLKTPADVDTTAAVGFRLFTLDPSTHVVDAAESAEPDQLAGLVEVEDGVGGGDERCVAREIGGAFSGFPCEMTREVVAARVARAFTGDELDEARNLGVRRRAAERAPRAIPEIAY